jgi:hypothetical protein
MISIPIILKEPSSVIRKNEPVSLGIPFAKGILDNSNILRLTDTNGQRLPFHAATAALWPDNSIKWIFVDFLVSLEKNETKTLTLTNSSSLHFHPSPIITIKETDKKIHIDTGIAQFDINKQHLAPFDKVTENGQSINIQSSQITLTDQNGNDYKPLINEIIKDQNNNSLRVTLTFNGQFESQDNSTLADFSSSLSFYAGSSTIAMTFTLHNPLAAEHPGGIWDLGDKGSIFFKDLVIKLQLSGNTTTLWKSNQNHSWNEDNSNRLSIYQESSGGENWNSNTHKNHLGKITHKIKGYRCQNASGEVEQGLRASPTIYIKHKQGGVTAYIEKFWQNFPKAIEANNHGLFLHLFPQDYPDLFELQGGERKSQKLYIDFSGNQDALSWVESKIIAQLPLSWYAQASALPYLTDKHNDENIDSLIHEGLTGTNNYFQKREDIDEFGWRNFGEIYADHETVGHEGDQTLVSHYNNQYDSLYGFARQYISTGDHRWFELMDDLARHIVDIDIYNTQKDRAEYNGGLFWHTDHYVDAFTCSHRTYSKWQSANEEHGGGPGTEHCYTTGLLYHYFLTGSESSKIALLTLRKWIENLNEGSGTLLERLLAIKNRDIPAIRAVLAGNTAPIYKYPLTRGTGNYINTILDAYELTTERKHIDLVDKIIKQTIHPLENVADRNLDNIEITWSYTVFLQSLVKYLNLKETINEYDDAFFYAKDSLLNFADWMLKNEYPFLDKPEILEYPNHTWVAQDIRKANLLYFAYEYSDDKLKRNNYLEKARFFHNYVIENLKKHETRSFSRILAILMQNHGPHSYFIEERDIKKYKQIDPIPYANINKSSVSLIISTLLTDLIKKISKISISNEIRWLQSRSKLFATFSRKNK